MDKIIRRCSLRIMFPLLFLLLPLTVQAGPRGNDGPQQNRETIVIRLELPLPTKGEVPPETEKSPSTSTKTFEQRIMRVQQVTPRTRELDLITTSSTCNQYTRPCFSWQARRQWQSLLRVTSAAELPSQSWSKHQTSASVVPENRATP